MRLQSIKWTSLYADIDRFYLSIHFWGYCSIVGFDTAFWKQKKDRQNIRVEPGSAASFPIQRLNTPLSSLWPLFETPSQQEPNLGELVTALDVSDQNALEWHGIRAGGPFGRVLGVSPYQDIKRRPLTTVSVLGYKRSSFSRLDPALMLWRSGKVF